MFEPEFSMSSDVRDSVLSSLGDNYTNYMNVTESAIANTVDRRSSFDIPYVILEVIVAIAAVVGNALVIVVFCRERKLRRKTNYYIISLASADFLVGSVAIPFAIMVRISVGIPQNYNACLLMMSSLLSFCTISIFSLVLISVDRFMSILFPLKYSEDGGCVTLEIIVCWLLGLFVGFLPFAWHEDVPINRCFYQNIITEGYQMFRVVVVVLLPACIIFTIYGMIYKIVLHQLKHENLLKRSVCCYQQPNVTHHTCIHRAMKREIKVTVNVFIIALIFMLCFLPLNIAKSIKILCNTCHVPHYLITMGIILTHFNSAINPALYAYHLKDFRQAILRLFGRRRRDSLSDF